MREGLLIDDEGDLREQRKARKYGERRGSRVVERACQVVVCRCWGREGLAGLWLRRRA